MTPEPSESESLQLEIDSLKNRLNELQSQLAEKTSGDWQYRGYYVDFYAAVGAVFGMFAAFSSLLFNVIGATLVGEPPLRLIQVYLTFPLGEEALGLEGGLALVIGCCLYIATGMVLGIPFHLVLTRFLPSGSSVAARLALATLLGIALWIVNFYAVLTWLQPQLFGGDWIVQEIPWWVAALTHLVFGWTMALLAPFGRYVPYQPHSDAR